MEKTKTVRGATHQQWNSEHTLDFLYGNAPPSIIGSLAVVLVLAYTLWSQVISRSLFFWTLSGIIIAAIRLTLWLGYRNRKEIRTPWFWLNSFRLMSLASGLLNGLAMWLKLTHAMHYRATHDALVGLLNRGEFENQFEIRLPLTRHGVAMLFVDLDNFKSLNDTFGHQAGDRALREVADILVKSLRADDVVARLGGDEFVTFLFLNDIKEIEKIAHNILQGVQAITFPGQHNYTGLSASIGIAFNHNNKVMFSQLMRAADAACYKSKEQGKNQMTINFLSMGLADLPDPLLKTR